MPRNSDGNAASRVAARAAPIEVEDTVASMLASASRFSGCVCSAFRCGGPGVVDAKSVKPTADLQSSDSEMD